MKRIIFLLTGIWGFIIPATVSGSVTDSTWADSVFRTLSTEQKIAQLLFIRANSSGDSIYEDSLVILVRTFNIGGVCFFKGSPFRQAALTNRFQNAAQTPLLISIDAECGLGMRLDSAFSFPWPMTLGAIRDDSLIYRMGTYVAEACKRLGVQINLAPVVDINNNSMNPVINFRSFGEDRNRVANKGSLYMKGMQDHGIMATAKHFPGHGDTDSDSHLTLPVINHSMARMDSIELFPFKRLINEGVKGVMMAHLYVPCFDSSTNIAATLSNSTVTGILKQRLGFAGLIITDALDMKGVTKFFKPGEIEVKALQAGNDILLLPQNARVAVKGIKQAVDSGLISQELIDQKCRKILNLKFQMGLTAKRQIELKDLAADLNPPDASALRNTLFKSSLTLVKDDVQLIPLKSLDKRKIASLSIGDTCMTPFQKSLDLYAKVDHFNSPLNPNKKLSDSLVYELSGYHIVLIGLHHLSSFPADSFGISENVLHLLDTLFHQSRCILSVFGNPYSLNLLPGLRNAESVIITYQDKPITGQYAAELIFGGIPAKGRLPVSVSQFKAGTGEKTEKNRLESVIPEESGIPSAALNRIDSIANAGIRAGAFPGCQILAAKDGKVFYYKSFGHPRYEDSVLVTNDDIYDLASVTKVAATTIAVMKLYDDGKIKLDDSLGTYLAELRGSNKSGLILRDVLAHQAGLKSWIPFYERTIRNGKPDPLIYQPEPSRVFPFRVAENLFIQKSYPDTILDVIIESPLLTTRDYKYSDLGFYLLKKIVEKISGKPFDQFLGDAFYKPMGLQTIGFRPLDKFERTRLIPTEMDSIFRMQVIWGDVNDPGAAMLGGISGHAGLFSDAMDLAVIFQMLLQQGQYGGKQYIQPKTVKEFTRVQFPKNGNRRGLGFDKPMLDASPEGPCYEHVPLSSFGHSGFTGNLVWADPENQLIYIFLSNRTYPDSKNTKLSEMNIRTNIQKVIYDILEKYHIN